MSNRAGQSLLDKLEVEFQAFEKSLNGQSQSPAHSIRKRAFVDLNEKGFPSTKDEEYKFTNLTKALEKSIDFGKANAEANITKIDLEAFQIEGLDATNLVFVNGIFSEELSEDLGQVEGAELSSLAEAFKANNPVIDSLFGNNATFENDAFIALNTAFSQNGVVLNVEANKVVEKPIVLHFIGDSTSTQSVYHIRNLISVGKGAEVTILEKFDTKGSNESFTSGVTEIAIEENARATYYKIENDNDKSYHLSHINVTQERASHFTANTLALNGAIVRNNLEIKLNDEACEAHMNGLYVVGDKTHIDNHTVVDHTKPNAYSNELYKGIMDDKSRGVSNGKIFVRQDAQKTNAFQSNKNILLTNDATVNTKPQLEIWADDVKCSHGCTTGQLDVDALFYLQARGIKKERARAILLHAFASDVIENLGLKPVRNYVEEIITSRLEK